jgi:hypothetical protein
MIYGYNYLSYFNLFESSTPHCIFFRNAFWQFIIVKLSSFDRCCLHMFLFLVRLGEWESSPEQHAFDSFMFCSSSTV